jgi:enamine deaminase RidA (YjgF/YER057c/UK114 family)
MPQLERENPPTVHRPTGYTHVVEVGGLLFLSGQTGYRPDGTLAGDTVEEQLTQLLENMKAVLAARGASMDDVAKITIFSLDTAQRDAIIAARDRYFPGDKPASTYLIVKALARPEILVEIEAIAAVPGTMKSKDMTK